MSSVQCLVFIYSFIYLLCMKQSRQTRDMLLKQPVHLNMFRWSFLSSRPIINMIIKDCRPPSQHDQIIPNSIFRMLNKRLSIAYKL